MIKKWKEIPTDSSCANKEKNKRSINGFIYFELCCKRNFVSQDKS